MIGKSSLSAFGKAQPIILLLAIFIGLGFNRFAPSFTKFSGSLIMPSIMAMLYAAFLLIPMRKLTSAFMNFKFTVLALSTNFIFTPIYAWTLGWLFLRDIPDLWIGLFLSILTPCTDWYLIFTYISKGNVPLCAALLPWNLLLQITLLPLYILIFAGVIVAIDFMLLGMIIFALFAVLASAQFSRYLLIKLRGLAWLNDSFLPKVSPAPVLLLSIAIVAIFAYEGEYLMTQPQVVLRMLPPLLLFYSTMFLMGRIVGKIAHLSYEDVACYTNTISARNSPTSLPIAVATFSMRPLIAISQAIEVFTDIPVLILISRALLWTKKRWTHLVAKETEVTQS